MMDQPTQTTIDDENDCGIFLVGIGASAGGLGSLEGIVRNLTGHDDCAYIIVQHLSADFESHLPEILQRWTDIPVHLIRHGDAVYGGQIFIAPAGKRVLTHKGHFLINDKDAEGVPLPIDDLFRSIAQEAGRNGIAVVVSGTGSDGTRGSKEIAENGGLVIAESPDTAGFNGMPQSLIGSGVCNLVLTPESIPAAIDQFVTTPISADQLSEAVISDDGGALEPILDRLTSRFGVDFTQYKQTTIQRRVQRRLGFRQLASYEEYEGVLQREPDELKQLFDDLLIGVTSFFRDEIVFDLMHKQHLRQLIEQMPATSEFRAWIAGCATGEEAYSMAMMVHEILTEMGRPPQAKIFATDLHSHAIKTAGAGIYPPEAMSGVSEKRKARFFEQVADGYRVCNDLRQMLIFAPHNVVSDAPFLRLDLICCRNLLIYLQPFAQRRVLSLFHFSLRNNGLLVLGTSETPGDMKEEFEALDSKWRIYRKRPGSNLNSNFHPQSKLRVGSFFAPSRRSSDSVETRNALLDQFMPAGILIDGNREVIHCYGGAEKYLRVPSGQVSRQITSLTIEPLRASVNLVLKRMEMGEQATSISGARAAFGDEVHEVVVSAERVRAEPVQSWVFLRFERKDSGASADDVAPAESTSLDSGHVQMLEDELQMTRENLQATIEELEASNEELQATNQELTASNEELQSTNEELHSVNEELFTVNTDHQRKIGDLIQATDDLNNLLAGTEVGVLFLDGELRIRKFTDNIAPIFELVDSDIGRSITAFNFPFDHDLFVEGLSTAQSSASPFEMEVCSDQGRWFLVRVLPYQSIVDRFGQNPALVVTVIDIDSIKMQEARSRRLRTLIDQSSDFVASTNGDGIIETWNRGAERMLGISSEDAVGKPMTELLGERVQGDSLENLFRGELTDCEQQVADWTPKGGTPESLMVHWRANVLRDRHGTPTGVSIIAHDIREMLLANRRVASSEHELRMVMESVTEAIAVLDDQWRYIFVNDGMCTMTERTREELLGQKIWDIFPDAVGTPFETKFRQAAATGDVVRFEEFYDPFGRWYQCFCFPSRGRLTVFFSDITEIRASTDLMRQQAEMLELCHDAVIAWEVGGGITFWNRGAEILYDHRKEDVIGKRTHEVFKTEHPVPPDEILQTMREKGDWEGRLVHYTRQGDRLNVASRHQLIKLSSHDREVVLEINRDMTEYDRLTSRVSQLASIADLTSDFVGTATVDGKILYINRGAATMLGYDSPEALRDKTIKDIHPPESLEFLRETVFPRVSQGGVFQFESEFLTRDGDRIPTSQVVMAHRDSKGNVTHYSTIARDISSRKSYELQLQSMREAAESANRAKSAFLAQMSHEIRTPMTAILGCSEQLRDLVETDEKKQLSRVMVEQGNALMAILDDILDLSRIEAEKIELEYRNVNICRVLTDLHRLMTPRAEETGLSFHLVLEGSFPKSFQSDPVRLRQVIVNLLSNAFKFTKEGSVHLIGKCTHGEGFSELEIKVRDSGVGIEKEDLKSIFEAFTRLNHPGAIAAGTGLGLTIAHRLVERLGGEMDVESDPGQGTTFSIRMPIPSPDDVDYVTVEQATRRPRIKSKSSQQQADTHLPIHVLVAEDTDAIRFLLSRILTPLVDKLTMVPDGQQAVDLVKADPTINIILMDMQMPILSGVEATKEIRQAGFDLPIVALTAGAMDADRKECIDAGCTEFLSKPINRSRLIALIEDLTEE